MPEKLDAAEPPHGGPTGGPIADAELAAVFTQARPRLVRIAYAVLGTHAEAEDVVSECWIRLAAANRRERVLDVEAWATVAVARGALDTLRSARVRRETYVGPWLPEPLVGDPGGIGASADPADRVTLDDSVSFALLVMLESLTPAERTAWVLHDLFGLEFTEVADAVGRSPAAVRQLAARARKHVAAGAPRVEVNPAEHRASVLAFSRAAAGGDLTALMTVLDPDVVLTSDGGGEVSAARRPVRSADKVARFVLGISGSARPNQRVLPIAVNGALGLALFDGDTLDSVVSLTVRGQRITRVDIVRAPRKLPHLAAPTSLHARAPWLPTTPVDQANL
jgi:RNA polymerase sigma-70 factor (ECF subfamily)